MDVNDSQQRRRGVDLVALARQRAEPYVGPTTTVDELVTGITELAAEQPSRARQLIESLAAALDDATMGRHTEQVDCLEQLVLHNLGLDAQSLVRLSEMDKRSGVIDEPEG